MKKNNRWKYLRHQARRMKKCARQRKLHKSNRLIRIHKNVAHSMKYGGKPHSRVFPEIVAPRDFRFLDNTEECATFFKQLRSTSNVSEKNFQRFKKVSLFDIELIDFSAVLTLSAICKELKCQNINVQGNFPQNESCRSFLVDSGFLDNKYDINGKMFHLQSRTKSMTFEQGQGKLLVKDIRNIATLSNLIIQYLDDNPNDNHPFALPQLFKEICANSIEWSNSYKRQWALAAKFEKDKVLVATIDLGQGILNSLTRRYFALIKDILTLKSNVGVLEGAFCKKYGSKSNEINRNRGLPSLKSAFEQGVIAKLIVITNNVLLSFDPWHNNCTFAKSNDAFKGTMYYFEINKNCLTA